MKKDTIIIFQKPDLYFFPYYKDIVYSPFGIPEKSFRYLLYKLLYILNLPCCSIFWGDWKKQIKTARQVIIFDYGYQKGMEKYIKKINPSCQVSLFFWNIITRERKNHLLFSDKENIFSTDKRDCSTYHFKYNHIFYPEAFYQPYKSSAKNRLFFLGVDKGRADEIAALKKILESCGIKCDIRLIKDRDTKLSEKNTVLFTEKRLSYKSYLREVLDAGILLDINQKGQTALTMRVAESVFLSKKLITNNKDITSYSFYNQNNILLLPEQIETLSEKQILDFLESPFLPYGKSVREELGFEHWKENFRKNRYCSQTE